MKRLIQDVDAYEAWLRTQCEVVEDDLDEKHARMASSAFMFLRATYFRWARTVPKLCPSLMDAPLVLCVGDVHVENFGTWRDADGRHVWGLNDFDEAAVMPYTLDLHRLVCSACLVPEIGLSAGDAAELVLDGFRSGLRKPGPVLMSEHADWYPKLAGSLADASRGFWKEYKAAEQVTPPAEVRKALRACMPAGTELKKFTAIPRGGGSRGRPRFQAIGKWQGGRIVREAKRIVPSAWDWSARGEGPIRVLELAKGPHRSADPSMALHGGYLLRRVSPSSRKLDLADVGGAQAMKQLLQDMGRELASVHSASKRANRIPEDLRARKKNWLPKSAEIMLAAVQADFADWKTQWASRAASPRTGQSGT